MQGCVSPEPEFPGMGFFMPLTTESLTRTPARGEGVDTEPGQDFESDQEGEYVDLTRNSLPAFGPQPEPLTQSVALNGCTKLRTRADSSLAAKQISSTSLRGAGGLVAASVPQGHRERGQDPEAQASDSGDCLENSNGAEREQLLRKSPGSPRKQAFAHVLPTTSSKDWGTKESCHTEVQGHPKHELDWRFAMCSFDDGEDAKWESAKAGPSGAREAARARRSTVSEHGSRSPKLCSGEAVQLESGLQPLATCCLCEENLQESAFSHPSRKSRSPESSSEGKAACVCFSQSLSAGMGDPSWPPEGVGEAAQSQAGLFACPSSDAPEQESSQCLAKKRPLLPRRQNSLEDASVHPGQTEGHQLQEDDGQSEVDCCLLQIKTVQNIPVAKQEQERDRPGGKTNVQVSSREGGDGVCQEEQLYLPGMPEALFLEASRDGEQHWTGQGDHPPSSKEAVVTHGASVERRTSGVEKSAMAGHPSSVPLTWGLLDGTTGVSEGDEAPEPSLKRADNANKGVDHCVSWEDDLVPPAYQEPSSSLTSEDQQTNPMSMKDVNWELLRSGVACLPGSRDKYGRAVIIITMRNRIWLNPHCNATKLTHLLLYLRSILRPECQTLGLTVLIDARQRYPVPAIFKALTVLQDTIPHCIHGALLLVDKDAPVHIEKPASVQCELLTSLKVLYKHIESSQLPCEFDGGLPYSHQDWLRFRIRLEHLIQRCRGASMFLRGAIQVAESSGRPEKTKEADALLKSYRQLMKTVLEDAQLIRLQSEGGVLLARLRKENSCVTPTEDYRDALEMAITLYNQVDEDIHRLVKISNKWIRALELVIDFEALEEGFREVSSWIENVGQTRLNELNRLDGSLEVLIKAQRQFQDFELVAGEYCQRGCNALRRTETWGDLSSSELQAGCRRRLHSYRDQLQKFCSQLDASRSRIDRALKLYEFVDQALESAQKGLRHLASIGLEDCSSAACCSAAIMCLEKFKGQHPHLSNARFEEMKELACGLDSSLALEQWHFAWSKCQEMKLDFERKVEAVLRTKRSLGSDWEPQPGAETNLPSREGEVPLGIGSASPKQPVHHSGWTGDKMASCADGAGEQGLLQAAPSTRRATLGAQDEASLQGPPSHAAPPGLLFPRKILRKAQSVDLACDENRHSSCQRTRSEPACQGNMGVLIRGLEVGSAELADRTCVSWRSHSPAGWAAGRRQEETPNSSPTPEPRSWSRKLQHIMEEMVVTEQEYVRSLRFVMDSYFPEMERVDLPQDLRGKRSVVFGNLEKLFDFHSQYFLRELEHCCPHPLRVSHCFLRHKDQFGLYALYSKNKPRSDSLLASHGNAFFRLKQIQLGDKMDLASYLLKPIQRMSKYALLLKDLIKHCGQAQEQELGCLRAAEEMVRFQLRHGNDLLAMDAIRDCDVNLKEQGQLVRQDEFSVILGRRKCQRHVFLFEDLILFSKPKRVEGGLDVYVYKRSFKTADIGLTENSGESGLRFEIWFRRRKSSDTYILQAGSTESKQAWTSDITKILWEQAARNKEIRMQEMVSMGVGSKPFLDIQPSEAAIHDRAIDYIMKGRGARTRASIAVSVFDHAKPYQRGHVSGPARHLSSCSVLGPLNLHTYLNHALLPGPLAASCPLDAATCVEEDEAENETGSQPSLTTESSGSSSQGLSGSGSGSSDSGCVSSAPPEHLCEDLGLPHSAPAEATPPREKACFPRSQYVSAV